MKSVVSARRELPSTPWVLYSWANSGNYNPSAAPAGPGNVSEFPFPAARRNTAFPAFLTTVTEAAVLGNLTGKTLSASINLAKTGNPEFIYGGATPWSSWNNCQVPANVRLYFSTNPMTYNLGDAGQNEDRYWWSQPGFVTVSAALDAAVLSDSFDPAHWSNANGRLASDRLAAFQAAVANVQQIGLAFGGGCFFDVGIAILQNTGTAQFQLVNFSAQ